MHGNKIRGGSELEQRLGMCNMNLNSLQHGNDKVNVKIMYQVSKLVPFTSILVIASP